MILTSVVKTVVNIHFHHLVETTILVFKNPNSITKHPHVTLSTTALNKGQVRKNYIFLLKIAVYLEIDIRLKR